jgi:restriction system protein
MDLFADGKEHDVKKELAPIIALQMNLSKEDLSEKIPSGRTRFIDRIKWAQSDLNRSGLIQPVRRGVYQITDLGKGELGHFPEIISREYLSGKGWLKKKETDTLLSAQEDKITDEDHTPEERIQAAYKELSDNLASELLDEYLKKISPGAFEEFVVELLSAMGYGTGEVTGHSGDGGIDGVIYQDRLRLDRIYMQAKRWDKGSIGSPEINGFIGAMTRRGATQGVFVTTSRYTEDAKKAAEIPSMRIKLINGEELANLAIEFNVGVAKRQTIEIKRIDSDYFEEN